MNHAVKVYEKNKNKYQKECKIEETNETECDIVNVTY